MTPKRSGTERALIGTDQRGAPIILATDGPWIAADVENISAFAEEIGLADRKDCPAPGLYLFEGYGHQVYATHESTYPDDTEYVGAVRPVRPEEVAELYAMEPPEVCAVCGDPATTTYGDGEGLPSCGRAACELRMQAGMDYHEEAGDR